MTEQPSLPDPDPDDNHTPSRLDIWELELTGFLKAYDNDGNEIFPGVRPTPELVDKLTDRLMDHWHHAGHYRWYHRLAHRLNAPLWVHRLIHCRKCEHDISGSAKLNTGEVSLTIWFDHKDNDD